MAGIHLGHTGICGVPRHRDLLTRYREALERIEDDANSSSPSLERISRIAHEALHPGEGET